MFVIFSQHYNFIDC